MVSRHSSVLCFLWSFPPGSCLHHCPTAPCTAGVHEHPACDTRTPQPSCKVPVPQFPHLCNGCRGRVPLSTGHPPCIAHGANMRTPSCSPQPGLAPCPQTCTSTPGHGSRRGQRAAQGVAKEVGGDLAAPIPLDTGVFQARCQDLCRQSRRTPARHRLGQRLLLFPGSCNTPSVQPAWNAAEAPSDGPWGAKRPAPLPALAAGRAAPRTSRASVSPRVTFAQQTALVTPSRPRGLAPTEPITRGSAAQ